MICHPWRVMEKDKSEGQHLMLLRGLFPCLPMIKMAEPNLVILMPFLAALQICGVPWGD